MYKLLDSIMLVCRDEDYNKNSDFMQAYLVDPSNKKQLKSARDWATWTEYGPSVKTESGKWRREWEKKHDPVEFTFDNKNFNLELLDCAGSSSQGGKLSFWNCLVTRDGHKFKIGVNSDMLLELLKNATFVNGLCQDKLLFVTDNGKVGMCAEGSKLHRDAVKDMEFKAEVKNKSVSKFTFGNIVETLTIKEVYLGTITQYYKFDPGRNTNRYSRDYNLRDCTIIKLAKPVKYHLFDSIYGETKLSDFANNYKPSNYYYLDLKKTCPKRTISGDIDFDITQEEFYKTVVNNTYDIASHLNSNKYTDNRLALYYFFSSKLFGFGIEPFELSEDIVRKINTYGIRYIDETADSVT